MMSKSYILKDGKPVEESDITAWGRWMKTAERHVANDELPGVRISTVFLGLDHQWGAGPPILYETMIFGGAHDGYQARYHTREDAVAGHAEALTVATGP